MSRFKTNLSTRMKRYEAVSKNYLTCRTPVIVRIDGRAFHTFVQDFVKPFDTVLMKSMEETMRYLCENIPGCVLGYKQSDEISLVLVDYQNLDSEAWFNYNVQKMCSVTASMATMIFNKMLRDEVNQFFAYCMDHIIFDTGSSVPHPLKIYQTPEGTQIDEDNLRNLMSVYKLAIASGAMFDARVFNIPKEDVMNYLVWRQKDAINNGIQMVGQASFTQDELNDCDINKIKAMLLSKKNIDWNDFADECKYGVCCKKMISSKNSDVENKLTWEFDKHPPIFNEDTDYVDSLVFVGE